MMYQKRRICNCFLIFFCIVFVFATKQFLPASHATICSYGSHIEIHSENNHGDVCRFQNQSYVCPLGCKKISNGNPPYCLQELSLSKPCRIKKKKLDFKARIPTQENHVATTMHTFFEPVSTWSNKEQKANKDLLNVWKEVWTAAGWKTKVVTLEDAKANLHYKTFLQILDAVPLGTNTQYDKFCYLRHLAMSSVGGGWMSDYDTIPLNIKPGMPLPNNGKWTSFESSVPSLVSGSKTEWQRMAFVLANVGKNKSEKLFSDMMAMQELAKLNEPPFLLEMKVKGWDKHYGNKLWGPIVCKNLLNQLAAHLSHFAFVTANKNQFSRANIINATAKKWKKKCLSNKPI